ncbi:MAG TPA: hypothetical protein VN911_15225 [Candidatus Acidoferrum sp.]|nr:hypothetical protein [Candidatus Acidoferrum sp.]
MDLLSLFKAIASGQADAPILDQGCVDGLRDPDLLSVTAAGASGA